MVFQWSTHPSIHLIPPFPLHPGVVGVVRIKVTFGEKTPPVDAVILTHSILRPILPEAFDTRTCKGATWQWKTEHWSLLYGRVSASARTSRVWVSCTGDWCPDWFYIVALSICVRTSAGNSFLSTVCSEPQALLSPQWKWNWHSLNLSCRGPPFSAAEKRKRKKKKGEEVEEEDTVRHSVNNTIRGKKEKTSSLFLLCTAELIWRVRT